MRVWIVKQRSTDDCLVSGERPTFDGDDWSTWGHDFNLPINTAEELFGDVPDQPKQVQLIGLSA